jgi:hypothetical protein
MAFHRCTSWVGGRWIFRFFSAPAGGWGRNGLREEDRPALLLFAGSSRRSGCVPARTTCTLLKGVYRKSVKLCGKEKQELEKRLSRSVDLPWSDITIQPLKVI